MEYIGRIAHDKFIQDGQDKIVIFGAGNELKKLLGDITAVKAEGRIACICDNNPKKQGKQIFGINICSPDEAASIYGDAVYIVYNQFCREICEQLVKRGITKIHLLRR